MNKILLSLAICLSSLMVHAQDVSQYYLSFYKIMVSIGEKQDIIIWWRDSVGGPEHIGPNNLRTGTPPKWTINGKNAASANKSEGSLYAGLNPSSAIYTAPDKIPPVNPVMVAVKFKANDTSKQEITLLCYITVVDPGQNWFFSFTGHGSSETTTISPTKEIVKKETVSGAGSLIVNAEPTYDGVTIINTEQGDPILKFTKSGSYDYYKKYESKTGVNNAITEKRLIQYSGTPTTNSSGLGFEYHDKEHDGGIQYAGFGFDVSGIDKLWNQDANGKLVLKSADHVNQPSFGALTLGSNKDKITEIKNGYLIDFSETKDSTHTDADGTKHTIFSTKEYHAKLIRVNKKLK